MLPTSLLASMPFSAVLHKPSYQQDPLVQHTVSHDIRNDASSCFREALAGPDYIPEPSAVTVSARSR